MIAFVTTLGEETTDLCIWALKRNGFEVHTISGEDSLCSKLKRIYEEARHLDIDFLRVDADVIVNKDCTAENIAKISQNESLKDAWWVQFQCWGWYSQKLIYGGVQFIKREALLYLNESVDKFMDIDRPETHLTRIYQFYNPRRFESYEHPMGIHGYGIKDIKPIIRQKANRGQSANYDFELTQRLNQL